MKYLTDFQIIDDVAVGVARTASVASKAAGGAAIGLGEQHFRPFCEIRYGSSKLQSNSVLTNNSGPAEFVRYNRVPL
jgi:hypothetical protein